MAKTAYSRMMENAEKMRDWSTQEVAAKASYIPEFKVEEDAVSKKLTTVSQNTDITIMRKGIPASYAQDGSADKFIAFVEANQDMDISDIFVAYKRLLGSTQTRELKDGTFRTIHYSPKTQNHYLDAAVNRMNYLLMSHSTTADPQQMHTAKSRLKEDSKRVKVRDIKVPEEKSLSIKEIDKLINECPDKGTSLIIDFMFRTGARISEALNILNTDIKPTANNHYLIPIVGKGSVAGDLKPTKDLVDRIRDHFQGPEYLFQYADGTRDTRNTVTTRIARHSKRILGRRVSAHCMRHSIATFMFKTMGTKRLIAIQKFMRHAKSSTTLDMYVADTFTDQDREDIENTINKKMGR